MRNDENNRAERVIYAQTPNGAACGLLLVLSMTSVHKRKRRFVLRPWIATSSPGLPTLLPLTSRISGPNCRRERTGVIIVAWA